LPPYNVWCYAPRHRIATAPAYKALTQDASEPNTIKLMPETNTAFVVVDPNGNPVAGAKVEPWQFLAGGYDIIPEPLRTMIGSVTDGQGRAALPAMGRDGFFAVRIVADGFGIQQQRLRDSDSEPAERKIALRETGSISGRLISDDPTAIRNVGIYCYQGDFGSQYTAGMAQTDTGDDGRFSVAEFAEGPLTLSVSTDKSLPVRPRIPEKLQVFAGKSTEVDVPLEPAVRVRGLVRTKEGHAPVAGASVNVRYGGLFQSEQPRTDAEGRFEAYVLPGQVRQSLYSQPEQFTHWMDERERWNEPIDVPAQASDFDLPPIELVETFERRGKLVDQDNEPVGDIQLSAVVGNRRMSFAKTKADGTFSMWLPENQAIDSYTVFLTHQGPYEKAEVISEAPLVLQVRR